MLYLLCQAVNAYEMENNHHIERIVAYNSVEQKCAIILSMSKYFFRNGSPGRWLRPSVAIRGAKANFAYHFIVLIKMRLAKTFWPCVVWNIESIFKPVVCCVTKCVLFLSEKYGRRGMRMKGPAYQWNVANAKAVLAWRWGRNAAHRQQINKETIC